MSEAPTHRDKSDVAIGLIIKAPLRDFEAIQRAIVENFPRSFIAYRTWSPRRLTIIRGDGGPLYPEGGSDWNG